MAFALRALGKDVRVVSRDQPPRADAGRFPASADIEIVERVDDPGDAVIVMECGDLKRTGIDGPRARLRHQHRSPSRQHDVRGAQLVRPVGGGMRRDGVRRWWARSACR